MTDLPPNTDPALWGRFETICTAEEYIESLRGRDMRVFLMGERVADPADHPMIRPSVNAMAATYALAEEDEELGTALSPFAGTRVNRFLHIAESADDLVAKARLQDALGRRTGTCFQRCVGLDALNSLHSVTYEIDAAHGTGYHQRLLDFLKVVQKRNQVIGGAMTDAKGDRSKAPHEQADPDMFMHVTRTNDDGVFVTGCKLHQTGCVNSHWLIVMPTIRLGEEDKAYAISGAVPAHAEGITYIYGRQASDTRCLEPGTMDQGNAGFSGQEAMIVFEDVFIPWDHVFMHGEYEFAAMLVERFTTYHRCSYICKAGVGDVLVGAAAEAAELNGVQRASHIRDKIVEMVHLNETIRSGALASAHEGRVMEFGRLPQRRDVCQCVQAERHPLPLRDGSAGAGHRRRADGDDAVGAGPGARGGRPAGAQVPGRAHQLAPRGAAADTATDREHDHRPQCGGVPHRVDARRRLAPGAADPDRPRRKAGGEAGQRAQAGRD